MLSLRDIHFTYPRIAQAALSSISFNIERGEILGLLGPNGAGKTTLISHLVGILALQQGSISLDGEPLAQSRRKNPSRIAIAPQEYAFYSALTVRENLACFGAMTTKKQLSKSIQKALVFAQLERFSEQQAQTLSGGLKRRLNLAIAILSNPDYLLLDEPTVGVDPQSRAFILEAVRELAQSGVGIIYTSHYMEEVEALAKRVVILDHGKMLREGSLDDLLNQGQAVLHLAQMGLNENDVTQILCRFGDIESLKVPAEPIFTSDPTTKNFTMLLKTGCTPSQALSALEQAGATITHADFGRFNLEQLFMQLTQRSLRD